MTDPSAPTDAIATAIPDDDAAAMSSRIERALWIIGAVLSAIVVIVLVVRSATSGWLAGGDFALMRMHALDVGTSDTPLVGVFSRLGWDHPGPFMFFAYAPFVRLVGGASYGLLLGALAVNLAAIGSVLWLAKRAGALVFASFAAVLAVLVLGFGSAELIDPWNPYVIILPLVAGWVAAWRCLTGDRAAAVVLVVAASFSVQTHVGAAVMVAAMLVIGIVGIVRNRAWHTAIIAGAVLFVCWLPPIIQQLHPVGQPGNLRMIVTYFLHGSEPSVGLAGALRLASRLLTVPTHRDIGWTMFPRDAGRIPWVAIALVVTTAWAWRRRMVIARSLNVLAWASLATFVIGAASVTGVPYPYLFRWGWAAVVLVWVAILVTIATEVSQRWPAPGRWTGTVLASVTSLALLATLAAGVDMTALNGWSDDTKAHLSLIGPALDAVRDAPSPTLLVTEDRLLDGAVANQLLFEAGEKGLDLKGASSDAYVYGHHRTVDPERARSTLIVASPAGAAKVLAEPGTRVVAADDDFVIILRE